MNMAVRLTPLWSGSEIAAATGGRLSEEFVVTGVSFDSREVELGHLFIAMRGEQADGHAYIDRALAAGAAGIICEQAIDAPHVEVADSFAALQALARAARSRCAGRIIGVTGSAGKTGTKEALAAALERHCPGRVHKSVKSYNNHTGVPLSLARMPRDTRYAVLEMGMNHVGELAELTMLVRPHVAIITTIAPAHVGHFTGVEQIADAKAEIFRGLEAGGYAIIPHDSPFADRLAAAANRAGAAHIIRFGIGEGAMPRARDWVGDSLTGGSLVTAEWAGRTLCFQLAPPGEHWVANAMAVLAAVDAVGGDLAAAGLALADLPGLAGRGARYELALPSGGHALLIDESYNANPASMRATIAQLGRDAAGGGRALALLGAMKELGAQSDHYHAALADDLCAAGVQFVWLVGAEMAPLTHALEGRIAFAHGDNIEGLADDISRALCDGDRLLVKGSNSVGLSRVVAALTGGGA